MSIPHRPPSWERLAKNHIPGRDWETICNVWSAAAIGFDPGTLSDLSQSLDPILRPDFPTRQPASLVCLNFRGDKLPRFMMQPQRS
jgi:hypothetical protein